MLLKGSCHCGAVSFSLRSKHPYPYQLCYCSICRKTQGGGGFAMNLGGDSASMKVKGAKHLSVYRARMKGSGDKRAHRSTGQRNFCSLCGSALWLYDPTWPELIHPFASAIDTKLPTPPARTHLMLDFKPDWVKPDIGRGDKKFGIYPKESIADWHRRHRVEK